LSSSGSEINESAPLAASPWLTIQSSAASLSLTVSALMLPKVLNFYLLADIKWQTMDSLCICTKMWKVLTLLAMLPSGENYSHSWDWERDRS
jgi:hypothetical protein